MMQKKSSTTTDAATTYSAKRMRWLGELPTLCTLWFSLITLYAMTTIANDEFYRFLFLACNPLILLLNGVALLMLLLQSWRYFSSRNKPTVNPLSPAITAVQSLLPALCALLLPPLMLIIGFLLPFAGAGQLTQLLHLSDQIWFKLLMLLVIVVPIWYGLLRLLQVTHPQSTRSRYHKAIFVGIALAWSLQAIYAIFLL